jgi:hypothetical protein
VSDRPSFSRFSLISLIVGGVALVLCALGLFVNRGHFFAAYLWAYMFWLGVALGAMAMVMVHSLTGGHWGTPVRRVLEAATGAVPLMAILFLPIVLGRHDLFIWARPEAVAAEDALRHRAPLFQLWFFGVRAIAYFAIWIGLAIAIRRFSWDAESGTDAALHRLRKWSALGLVIYLMTMTHAGIDWVLSRDVHVYSTAFGFVLTTGQTLAAFAFALVIMTFLSRKWPQIKDAASDEILIDQGNILMTLVVLWAYVSFFQFLVIWMGNTREDNQWYAERGVGGQEWWKWVGVLLMAFHFAVPFTLLLFRSIKRQRAALVAIAASLFIAHIVEQAWHILPSSSNDGPILRHLWMDLAAVFGIGGLWMAWFFWDLGRRPLLPREIPEAIAEGAA